MSTAVNQIRLVDKSDENSVSLLDGIWSVKLSGNETAGQFALVEHTCTKAGSIPLHLHEEEAETLYVVEGEIELQIGESITRLGPGVTVHLPKRAPHAYRVIGDLPCRILHAFHPAGLENYFREAQMISSDRRSDWWILSSLGAEYGLRFLAG
jgi:quercetin dioxygenase-like cupin family protein